MASPSLSADHQAAIMEAASSKHIVSFWTHVQESDGCWEWMACKNNKGYGCTPATNKTYRFAHRMSYLLHFGPIPEGMLVCHRCDNPGRVRPDHLFLGTYIDNALDKISKGRGNTGDNHPWRKNPELIRRGERHPCRINPELRKKFQGRKNGMVSLTEGFVKSIRLVGASGLFTITQIAKEFGISRTNAWNIIHRKRWGHLE